MDSTTFTTAIELFGFAAFSGFVASLACGAKIPSATRALGLGLFGTYAGRLLFEALQLPPGPAVGEYALAPTLVGTAFALALASLLEPLSTLGARRTRTV